MKKTLVRILALALVLLGLRGTGAFAEEAIVSADTGLELEIRLPVNPYFYEAQRQPAEIAASDATIAVSGANSTETGVDYPFTVTDASGSAASFHIQIWKLEGNAYSTVYMTDSPTVENLYVFYETGSFRIEVVGYNEEDAEVGSGYLNVNVSAGAAGTTVAEKVAAIAAECRAQTSGEYETALWLHDWLIGHANYDHSYSIYGADGVLMRGSGVCDSYSKAYVLLLNALGIENQREIGNAGGGGHSWNLAKIEGNWCQIDCTWDDPNEGGYENHEYFGINDTMMARDHSWDAGSYPACTSLDNYYYARLGFTLVSSTDELTAVLNSLAESRVSPIRVAYVGGEAGFHINSAFSKWFYTWNWKYGMTAYQRGEENGEFTVTYGEPWDEPEMPDAPDFTLYSPYGHYQMDQYSANNGLVLVFGRTTCGNTRAYLNGLQTSLNELQENGVDVLVSLDGCFAESDVWAMEAEIPGYRYTYFDRNLMWQYLYTVGVSGSVTLPCIFYMSPDGKIADYSLGPINNMDEAVQLALSLETGNPIPEPIRHTDYTDYEQGTGDMSQLSGGSIISAVNQARQNGYVYLLIDYYPATEVLSAFETNAALYERLGLRAVASFFNPSDIDETAYGHTLFAEYDDNDFWSMLRAAGFDTSGNISYSCAYLIDPSGKILAAVNGSYLNVDECAGYLANQIQYASTVPAALTTVDSEAFSGDALTSLDLDNGVLESIGEYAFAGNTDLGFVHIPDSVTTIADNAFDGCDQTVIVCTVGSEAHRYACENGFLYVFD